MFPSFLRFFSETTLEIEKKPPSSHANTPSDPKYYQKKRLTSNWSKINRYLYFIFDVQFDANNQREIKVNYNHRRKQSLKIHME